MIYETNGAHNTIINLDNVIFINLEGNKLIFFFSDGRYKKEIEYVDVESALKEFKYISSKMK